MGRPRPDSTAGKAQRGNDRGALREGDDLVAIRPRVKTSKAHAGNTGIPGNVFFCNLQILAGLRPPRAPARYRSLASSET